MEMTTLLVKHPPLFHAATDTLSSQAPEILLFAAGRAGEREDGRAPNSIFHNRPSAFTSSP